jgi:hypothetical protein
MTDRKELFTGRPIGKIARILLLLLLIGLLILIGAPINVVKAQSLIGISGIVTAREGQEPLAGVAVQVKGQASGCRCE